MDFSSDLRLLSEERDDNGFGYINSTVDGIYFPLDEKCTEPTSVKWGSTQAQVIMLNYHWTVKNFSCFSLWEPGESIKSPSFSGVLNGEKECEWCLEMYPCGWTNDMKDNIGLFLYLVDSKEGQLRAKYRLSVVNDITGAKEYSSEGTDRFTPGEAQGWPAFIGRHCLTEKCPNVQLRNEVIVLCEMQIVVGKLDISGDSTVVATEKTRNMLSEDFANLFHSKLIADVTLCCNGREIKAHQAILAARSPVFAAMFDHKMSEAVHQKVFIEDIEDDVLQELLVFMYSGTSPDLDKVSLQGLLAAADRYDVKSLKTVCEQGLCRNVTVENAASLLMLADFYNASELKDTVMHFIQGHGANVIHTEGWKKLTTESPKLIVDLFQDFFTNSASAEIKFPR